MTRCPACPGINNPIPPDGPDDAKILFIGEAPGKQEQAKGRVFIGKTGEELTRHYLPLAGLRRENVMITNSIRCLPPGPDGKLDPKSKRDKALLESCSQCHLYPMLERMRPKLIVPMGNFACQSLDKDISLELQRGIPIRTAYGTAIPMYHPAAGIHMPKSMLYIRTGWISLKKYLKGTLVVPVDKYPNPDYAELQDDSELGTFYIDPYSPLACDTETMRGGAPFCITYSNQPGTGRLIRSGSPLLQPFQEMLDRHRAPILFHNWLFDWDVTLAMGLHFPYKRIRDTMQRLAHLGNQAQGLKAAAYRHLGMTMQDFDDLVTPYSTEKVLDFYRAAKLEDWPKPDPQLLRDPDTGLWKLKQPHSLNTKLKTFFTTYAKNEERDVFGMWDKNWVDHHDELEAACGPYPGKCISHVPFKLALYYACRDADATLRLWPLLERAMRIVRRRPEHEWLEAA